MSVLVNPYRFATAGGGSSPDSTIAALSPSAWYDPSILSSVFTGSGGTTPAAVGDPVSKLQDLSGNGKHLVVSGVYPNNCPILRNSGSLYWLEHTNLGHWLDCTGLTLTQPNDFAAGVWWDNIGASRNVFDGITTRQSLFENVTGTVPSLYAGTVRSAGSAISTGTPYVYVARFNGGSSFIRTNGTQTAVSASIGTNGLNGLRVGTFTSSSGQMYGRIYFLLCRDTVFDSTETTTIETYGKTKTGASF